MITLHHITQEWLGRYKTQIMNLSDMTEDDIRKIWIRPGEDPNVDLSTIVYNYDIPLYQKMIFRYRHCSHSAPAFFRQIDPGNQMRMLAYFLLFGHNVRELIEFFAWIANGLGAYDIVMLEFNDFSDELHQQSTYIPKWKKNQITFFFELPEGIQASLLARYNKECVDAYNEIIDKKFNL